MDKESKKIKKILLKEDLQTGSKVVSYVYETYDYSLFTTFKENREPDHVGRRHFHSERRVQGPRRGFCFRLRSGE